VLRAIRALGWSLISLGVLILLYLVYLLFFTNLQTQRAQAELLEQFELEYGPLEQALPGEEPVAEGPREPVDPGDAYAAMWFERPGSDEPLVHEAPLFLVEGVGLDVLRDGPGHYPESAAPGEVGNFAVAGHRTTYGAPFYHLDDVVAGDEIHVVDRAQREWVYVVRETRIVSPGDVWVVGPDPLGTGGDTALLTLTTCHPRFSARQRLVVFAELATPVA
jgi:sortase A